MSREHVSPKAVAVLVVLVAGTVVGTGVFADAVSAERVVVEAGTDNVDGDGRVGPGETTDGDGVYGSVGAGVEAATAGDVVDVAPGVYEESVVVRTERLTVDAAGATLQNASDVGAERGIAFEGGVETATVRGLTVEGFELAVVGSGPDVSSDRVVVRNVTAENTSTAVSVLNAETAVVENVTVRGSAFGVFVSGVDSVVVRDVDLRGGASAESADGVVVGPAETAAVENVTVTDYAENGVLVGATRSVTVTDITATDNGGDGVVVNDTEEVSVDGVVARNNAEAGVDVGNVSTVSVADVTVTGAGANGIAVSDFGTATVSEVLATDNGLSGINLSEGETATATDVRAVNNDVGGIDVIVVENATARGVQVSENGDGGVLTFVTERVTLRNVSVDSNSGIGAWFINTDGRLTVTDLTATDNTDSGVRLSAVDDFSLTDVRAIENGVDGLRVQSSGQGPGPQRVEGSVFRGNGDDGLSAGDGTDGLVIRRTVFAENAGLGVETGETDTLVDARENYWGAPDGPNSDGPLTDPVTGEVADGDGDAVSGSVTESQAAVRFDPFLTEAPGSGPDAGLGPLARFDTDGDGRIESGEVLDAIVSFNADVDVGGRPVSAQDVLDVVVAYNVDQPV